jgi:hypothetical protein
MKQRLWLLAILIGSVLVNAGLARADGASASLAVGLTVAAPGQARAAVVNATFTPGAAAIMVAKQGYSNIKLLRSDAGSYVFAAISRQNGRHYLISVAAWQGRILGLTPG